MKKHFRVALVSFSVLICIIFSACDFGPSPGAFLSVSRDRCVGCRKCVEVCDSDAITIISNKAVIDPSKCIECLKCIDACPYDAIK